MNFFYWLGQLIRWSLVVMSLYLAIVWQGHEPPVIDASKMQVSEGRYGCPSKAGSKSNRTSTMVDGIKYMEHFGFVTGVRVGASCYNLQGRNVVVWWLPIYEDQQRLLLQVMDKETQQIFGLTTAQNLRNYSQDIQDKYGLYLAKFLVLLLALGLIFRKQSDKFLNFLRGKQNG